MSSLVDGAVCIYTFHLLRMASSVFYYNLNYLQMVSSVLELIIVCGGIVMGLLDGLLIATSKMVTLTGLMDILLVVTSKMVAL